MFHLLIFLNPIQYSCVSFHSFTYELCIKQRVRHVLVVLGQKWTRKPGFLRIYAHRVNNHTTFSILWISTTIVFQSLTGMELWSSPVPPPNNFCFLWSMYKQCSTVFKTLWRKIKVWTVLNMLVHWTDPQHGVYSNVTLFVTCNILSHLMSLYMGHLRCLLPTVCAL